MLSGLEFRVLGFWDALECDRALAVGSALNSAAMESGSLHFGTVRVYVRTLTNYRYANCSKAPSTWSRMDVREHSGCNWSRFWTVNLIDPNELLLHSTSSTDE